MIRIGETVKKNVKYYYRPGIYGIIKVNDNILLTEQNEKEIQLLKLQIQEIQIKSKNPLGG